MCLLYFDMIKIFEIHYSMFLNMFLLDDLFIILVSSHNAMHIELGLIEIRINGLARNVTILITLLFIGDAVV